MKRAVATIQLDNASVRVTEWRVGPGAATGHHRHQYAYVVVPMTTGRLTSHAREGTATNDLVAGHAYYRDAGVAHDVVNDTAVEIVFVEVELKTAPSAAGAAVSTTSL
jgi:quercetin dioxygenase-like cupin family protein